MRVNEVLSSERPGYRRGVLRHFARFIIRRSALIALIGTALAFIGAYYTVLLYKNLRTDIEELLPTTARSVLDLGEVTSRLEAIDNLVLLAFSKDTVGSRRFIDDLAAKLAKVPKTTLSSVEYRIDQEIRFFQKRSALFVETKDLVRIRDFIRSRINYEMALYNPLNIFDGKQIPEPALDLLGLKNKYEGKTSAYARFKDGYYATPDEKVRLLVTYMPGKGIDSAHRLKNAVAQAVQELDPKKYAADLDIKYTGNLQNLLDEQAALMADLELSTIVCVLLVAIVMLVYFRSIAGTAALVFSLFMGTFWTFGVSYFLVGYLNANSAFMASIVIGNGINFGIILLARYLEERRAGRGNLRSLIVAIEGTTTSTWTAAMAAALAYGSLMLTSFRGFNQFGVIGFAGMVLCWASSFVLMPSYLALWSRYVSDKSLGSRKTPKAFISSGLAWLIDHYSAFVWAGALALVALSLFNLRLYKNGVLETDMLKLRDKDSMEHGSGYYYRYIDEIFQHSLSPTVVLPRKREHSRQIEEAMRELKAREGANSPITTIQTLEDFVPRDQAQKIQLLREIKGLLPTRLFRRLPPQDQQTVRSLLTPEAFQPFTENDLPAMVLSKFTERDGSIGKMVLVDKVINVNRPDDVYELMHFVDLIRNAVDAVAPGSPVAGQLPISADMSRAIVQDGPKATLFAFIAVVVLVIVLFRNVKVIALCLMALLLGVTWMAGGLLGWGIKINFLNFVGLPITFGIGVDYGVNIFHRYRVEGPGSIIRVIRNTGGAVLLASTTTIIGYSSLLIAGNQAFVSFGKLAVLGEITCVTAAVIALPAFLRTRDRLRVMKQKRKEAIA